MSRSKHPFPLHRRPVWLLTLGLLAMALHLLVGGGLVRAAAGGGDSFVAAVCASHGVVAGIAALAADDSSAPASVGHDCCKLCAAGGPLLLAGIAGAVSPVPTFTAPQVWLQPFHPRPSVLDAHAPRGPPAQV